MSDIPKYWYNWDTTEDDEAYTPLTYTDLGLDFQASAEYSITTGDGTRKVPANRPMQIDVSGTLTSEQVERLIKEKLKGYATMNPDRQRRITDQLRDSLGKERVQMWLARHCGSRVYRHEERCGFLREDGAFMSDRDLINYGDQAEWKLPEEPVKKKGKNVMKTKTQLMNMAAMLADDIVTVKCKFSKSGQEYVYKADKAFAATLEKGDRCVATKDDHVGFVCIVVHEVEDECLLDDEDQVYQWLISKVDVAEAERLQIFDEGSADQLRKAQRKSAKRALLKTLADDMGEDDIQGAFALPAPEATDKEDG